MPTPDEVVEELNAARQRVSNAVEKIQAVEVRLGQLRQDARDRLEALRAQLDALRAHVQSETERVREAEHNLDQKVLEASGWLRGEFTTKKEEAGQLVQRIVGFIQTADSEEQLLVNNLKAAHNQSDATHDKIVELSQHVLHDISTKSGEAQQLAQDAARTYDDSLRERSSAAISEMLERISSDLQRERVSFGDQVQQTVSRIDSASDRRAQSVADKIRQSVQAMSEREKQGRDKLHQKADAVSTALQRLSKTLLTAGETVIAGTDTASDLMQATNVGIGTVIGIFENLKAIFEEIEEMWQED